MAKLSKREFTASGGVPTGIPRFVELCQLIGEEKDSLNTGEEFASDRVLVRGLVVWYPTMRHVWLLTILQRRHTDLIELNPITLYVLSMPSETAAFKALAEDKDGSLLARSLNLLADHAISFGECARVVDGLLTTFAVEKNEEDTGKKKAIRIGGLRSLTSSPKSTAGAKD